MLTRPTALRRATGYVETRGQVPRTVVIEHKGGTGRSRFRAVNGVDPKDHSGLTGVQVQGQTGKAVEAKVRQPPGRVLYGLSSGRGASSSIGGAQTTTARLCVREGRSRRWISGRGRARREVNGKVVCEETWLFEAT